jgi:hypothetical protein
MAELIVYPPTDSNLGDSNPNEIANIQFLFLSLSFVARLTIVVNYFHMYFLLV